MPNVQVWNDNSVDHVEKFRGDEIKIKSKSFIVMDSEDAYLFKGQFFPPKFNKSKLQTIESMKCIRIVEDFNVKKEVSKTDANSCMKCGFKAESQAGLKSHIRSKHVDSMVDEDAKKEITAE